MEARIARLERQLRQQRLITTALVLTIAVGSAFLVAAGFQAPSQTGDVIRARGLVLVDEEGRERILIGAPIPAAANRIRTDLDRVRETWASGFPDPDGFMDLYGTFKHSTNGILILDENGHDRLSLGAPTPDLYYGKRIGPSTGIQINDERGSERSGYGLLDVNGEKRVVLGLDSDNGTEGLTLALVDGGYTGVTVRQGSRTCFLGSAEEGAFGDSPPFHGLAIKDGAETKFSSESPSGD